MIDNKTKDDAVVMWVALSRIRSLLPVQMSKEEEELVRELLWTLVNNHVFFQHPDLIRILRHMNHHLNLGGLSCLSYTKEGGLFSWGGYSQFLI